MWIFCYNSELMHYGVKGMKWGVRRTPEQLGHAPKKKVEKQKKAAIIESKEKLLKELTSKGIKHSPEETVMIDRDRDGKIFWLEKGKPAAGLTHILMRHEKEFEKAGINREEIPAYIRSAIKNGKVIGHQGKREPPRPIYEFSYNGKTHRIAIEKGNNGFIVSANYKTTLKSGESIDEEDKIQS